MAIISALDEEIKHLRCGMMVDERIVWSPLTLIRGKLGRVPLLLMKSGMGKPAMSRAMAFLFSSFSPAAMLHLGFSGGTEPHLGVGDLVIGTEVIDAATNESFSPGAVLLERAVEVAKSCGLRHWSGGIVTVADIVQDPHEKAFLGTQHTALAVDMESVEVAKACAARQIPYLVVRAILDPLDMRLPLLGPIVTEEGSVKLCSLLAHLIRRPQSVVEFSRLRYCAEKARENLTAFAERWIKESV